MGLFRDRLMGGQKQTTLLPADAPALLASYGRAEAPVPGEHTSEDIVLAQIVLAIPSEQTGQLLDELLDACRTAGGWSYHGAWDLLMTRLPADPEGADPRYVEIVDGVLDALRDNGFGPGDIPMALTRRAIERDRAAAPASPAPLSADVEPKIEPLAPGEQRLLQVVDRPDGEQNRIYLIARRAGDPEGHGCALVIDSSDATDFEFDTAWAWFTGEDERALYVRLAEAHANAASTLVKTWLDPKVQYFADRCR